MSATLGRNDTCFCGSGRKFKHCHGALAAATPAAPPRTSARPLPPQEIHALVSLINQERCAEAEAYAEGLLRRHPQEGMLWKVLGVARVRQKKNAMDALQRAVELLPGDLEALRNLGAALHDREEWAAALPVLERLLATDPDHADTLLDAADALRGLSRVEEAVTLYRRALALDPKLAEAHNNLGNALLELKRPAEAEQSYAQAHALRPQTAKIHFNLGNARLALAKRAEAAESYRRALELDPNSVETLHALAGTLRDLGKRRDAIALYRRAVELDPRRAESHCNLGNVLFEVRQVEEAMACHRRALSIQPDYAPAHLSLAFALRQQRRPDEAEASCRAALERKPDYVEALGLLGELKADRGQFEEAEALFRRAIGIDPDFTFGYTSLATHRRITAADQDWLEAARALLDRALPLNQQIGLRYALGKSCDDLKDYDAAFEHYRAANELTKGYGARLDRERLTQRVDGIIARFPAERLQGGAGASGSQLPVLVIGMPRSGTSLTEQILASHPQVFGAGEVTFWNGAYERFQEAEAAGRSESEALGSAALEYLGQLGSSSGGAARVIDKLPANFMYAGLIAAALPRARFIHMRRHPLDTCLSIYFQNFFNIGPYANDLDDLAYYYREYLRLMAHWRSALPSGALLEVPYEGLVAEPERWTRRMLEFIELPWDSRCLEFHRTERVVITASKWQVRQKINSAAAGRWRNYEKHLAPLRGLLDLV